MALEDSQDLQALSPGGDGLGIKLGGSRSPNEIILLSVLSLLVWVHATLG